MDLLLGGFPLVSRIELVRYGCRDEQGQPIDVTMIAPLFDLDNAHIHLRSNSRVNSKIYQVIVDASYESFQHLHNRQPRSQPQTSPSPSMRGWRFHNAQDLPKAI